MSGLDDLFQPTAPATGAPSGDANGLDSLFQGPPPPPPERSYIGASIESGLRKTVALGAGAVADTVETVSGMADRSLQTGGMLEIMPKADLLRAFKNNPEGFKKVWDSPLYAAHRLAESQNAKADEPFKHLSPRSQEIAAQSFDPIAIYKGEAKGPGLERYIGGQVQQIPNALAVVPAIAAAVAGGPVAGAAVGGALEGTLAYGQMRQDVRQKLLEAPVAAWDNSQEYKDLIAKGWHPEMARNYLIEEASKTAALKSGFATALVSAVGGGLVGRVIHAPGSRLGAAAVGALEGGATEFVQSGLDQIIANNAERRTVAPGKDILEGSRAAAFEGAALGMGPPALTAAVARRRAAAVQEQQTTAILGTPPDLFDPAKTPPMAISIARTAPAFGVDPRIAVAISHIETGGTFNPTLINSIGAQGLFQFLPGAKQTYGTGPNTDWNDPATQIQGGLRYIADTKRQLTSALGVEPTPGAYYMASLFGHGGAKQILAADPSAKLLDVVAGYDPKLATQTLTGNGLPLDITVGQAREKYEKLMASRMGIDLSTIDATNPGVVPPDVAALQSRARRSLDDKALDELLDADRKIAVTDEQLANAGAVVEPTTNGTQLETLQKTIDRSGEDTRGTKAAPVEMVQLPANLAATQIPLYIGNARPEFSDALGKAIWAAGANSSLDPATRQAYRDWLAASYGMTPEEINNGHTAILKHILRENADDPTSNSIKVPAFFELGKPQPKLDTGLSQESQTTRDTYSNPNNAVARHNRTVAFGPPSEIGKPLHEASVKPGTVLTVGQPTIHTSEKLMKAVHQTVQQVVSSLMPSARVIITNETRHGVPGFYINHGDGWYQINPRNLTNLENTGFYNYNKTAIVTHAYSLFHELGHVLVDHEFMRGLSREQQQALGKIGGTDLIPEALLKSLPRDQQRILREFNEIKSRLIDDPKATAKDFIQTWLSPWKITHGVEKGNPANAWARYATKYFGETAQSLSARDFALRLETSHPGILGVHEYLAEQFSRAAYQMKLVEQTALGKTEWFAQTLAKLRELYNKLTDGMKAAPKFKEWLQQLAKNPEQIPKNARFAAAPESLWDGTMRYDQPDVQADSHIIQYSPEVPDHLREPAMELVRHGQAETAKEIIEVAKGQPLIMRWDQPLEGREGLQTALGQLDKLPGARGATRTYMATGARMLGQLAGAFQSVRRLAAGNPDVVGLQQISIELSKMMAFKARLNTDAAAIVQSAAKLSKKQLTGLQALMQEEISLGRHIPTLERVGPQRVFQSNNELADMAKKHGLTEDTVRVFLGMKQEYLRRMNLQHLAMKTAIEDKMAAASIERQPYYLKKLKDLADTFEQVKLAPFSHQTRFGDHFLEVLQNGRTIHVQGFSTIEQRQDARAKLQRAVKGLTFREHNTDSMTSVMRVLPIEVHGHGGMDANLTPGQRRSILATLDPVTKGKDSRRYSLPLAKITGHADNLLQVFAEFMHHDGLVLTRTFFKGEFQKALAMIDEDRRLANIKGGSELARLEMIARHAEKDVRQILNPAAEWHMLRSFVVFHDLAFSVKAAVANLTDMTKAWAVVTHRLGTIPGTMRVGKDFGKMAADQMVRAMQSVRRAPVEGAQSVFSPEERQVLERAQKEGLFTETLAADLSQAAMGSNLERIGLSTASRVWRRFYQGAFLPLRVAEELVRRSTFLSVYGAYRQQGLEVNKAFELAVGDVHLLVGDNSIQNRPPVMRGKASILMMYQGFVINTMDMLSGGYTRARKGLELHGGDLTPPKVKGWGNETLRLWLALAAMGGLMGLPGAEDLDRLLELVAKQVFGARFSLKDHAFEAAKMISELAADAGVPIAPRSIVHGLGSDVLGLDISGSIGMGNVVPGMGKLDKAGDDNFKFFTGLMGPAGNMLAEAGNLFDEKKPWLDRAGLFVPRFAKNITKALDDDPKLRSGAHITVDPRTGEITDLSTGQRVAQMMGFNPSELAARAEMRSMQYEYGQFWIGRKNLLMAQLWEAKLSKNQDAIHDVLASVSAYNRAVPSAAMAITRETMDSSMKNRGKIAREQELGLPHQKGLSPGYRDILKSVLGD